MELDLFKQAGTPLPPAFYIVDVMPMLYSGHFVFLKNPRLTSTGVNTSALTVFASSLLQLIETRQPTHLALVFDSRTATFRHEIYPEYKAQREAMPEDLAAAIPMALELAEALGLPVLRVDGFEADDLMGTLATKAKAEGMTTFLVTPDKDIAQLVDETTFLYRPGRANESATIYGIDEVCRYWGVSSPGQMIDLLGMAGDASDNIPGIRGVGEKTASKLLTQFGSLQNVLANTEKIKGKLAEKVAEGAEAARLSYRLATIRRDVPMEYRLDEFVLPKPNRAALRKVLSKYELLQIGRRLLGADFTIDDQAAPRHSFETEKPSYSLVQNEDELRRLLEILSEYPTWAFDTETTGTDPWQARLIGMSFAIKAGQAWYLPVPAEQEKRERLMERLRPLFADPDKRIIGHNIKYDLTVLRRHGIEVKATCHDTLLTHYVLDAAERHSLDHLAETLLNYDTIRIDQLIGGRGKDPLPKSMDQVPLEQLAQYAAEDADITLRLYHSIRPEATRAGLLKALEDCEEPLVPVLIDMEAEGIRIDSEALKTYADELATEMSEIESEVYRHAGEFNLNSPKQLGEVLFDHLKISANAKKTPTGQYATGEDVLLGLKDSHPIVDQILEYRAVSKLKSTYVDKLPEHADPDTGRVHTRFSQALTETGRLSSSDPNLQNIPIRTARGRRIRAAFVARDADHALLSADYSQIELRVMAALSGDRAMRQAFAAGADIHTETASRVFDVLPLEVTPEMRDRCKMVNFGIIYGISAFGLGQRLGIPRSQAAELIETYFEKYPGIKRYMDKSISEARERGYASTILGRRRYLRDIDSRNGTARQAAERNAINTPVQGSAADLIKLAMVRISREIAKAGLKSRMVLQIHDELLFDTPRNEVADLRNLVSNAMRGAIDLGVPLVVQIGTGDNWLEAHS